MKSYLFNVLSSVQHSKIDRRLSLRSQSSLRAAIGWHTFLTTSNNSLCANHAKAKQRRNSAPTFPSSTTDQTQSKMIARHALRRLSLNQFSSPSPLQSMPLDASSSTSSTSTTNSKTSANTLAHSLSSALTTTCSLDRYQTLTSNGGFGGNGNVCSCSININLAENGLRVPKQTSFLSPIAEVSSVTQVSVQETTDP